MNETDPIMANEFKAGEPAWRMALLFPPQGSWSEQEYLALDAGRQIEFDRGFVEVLELPTIEHQRIVRTLFLAMQSFVSNQNLGEVFFAPLPVRLWNEKYREPDLVFLKRNRSDASSDYPHGADLVAEVVSSAPNNRRRDLEIKLAEYQQAAIPEYWIVDPVNQVVLVHHLVNSIYSAQSFAPGQSAKSQVLSGFSIAVEEVLSA